MFRILLLFSCLYAIKANTTSLAHFCCEGENIVYKGKCANGKSIDLTCRTKTLLDPDADEEEAFELNTEGELIYAIGGFPKKVLIDKSQYCVTKLQSANNSDVAIICLEAIAAPDEEKWYSLRAACGIVSVVFLLATLAVYFLVPSLRDLQGKCIMHNVGALAIATLNLSIVQLTEMEDNICVFFAFFTYFTFMTAFFWLNVTSFHIWKTVVYPNILGTDKQWYLIYLVYGHGMPILFLIILLMAHHIPGNHLKPGIGVSTCWFRGLTETWGYFYGPIAILLILNLIMFIWCITKLWIERKTMNDLNTKSLKYKVRLYIKLFVIMGIMWVFEIISSVLENVHAFLDYVWIVTDYINVLQGALIFFLLVVLRKRALRGLSNRGFCCFTFPSTWKNFEDEETLQEDGEVNLNAQ